MSKNLMQRLIELLSPQTYQVKYSGKIEIGSFEDYQQLVRNNPERCGEILYQLMQQTEVLEDKLKKQEKALDSYKNHRKEVDYLRSRVTELENEIEKKEGEWEVDKNNLTNTLEVRNEELRKSLAELLEFKRNPLTTSTDSSAPQHHLIFQDFKQLKDQDFHLIATSIFNHHCEGNDADIPLSERKLKIATIRHLLSKEILINGLILYREKNLDMDSKKSVILEKAIKVSQAYLKYQNQKPLTTSLESEIQDLVLKSCDLLLKAVTVIPPGEFWMAEDSFNIDPDRHEVMSPYPEEGFIGIVIHPGYSAINPRTWEQHIFHKALVITVLTQEERNVLLKTVSDVTGML